MKTSRSSTIGVAGRAGIAAFVLVLLAAPALAGFSGTDLLLPSVGRGPGASSSQWTTTVWIANPSSSTATVQVMFLERKKPNLAPVTVTVSVPPGDTARYADAISEIFGFDSKFGALRFVSDQKVVVSCRIFNTPAGGAERDTQGQDYAGIPAAFGISKTQTTQLLGVYQTSTDKSVSPFRYSFGFAESAGGTASVRVKAYDATGAIVAEKDYGPLGAYEVEYYPIEDLSPSIASQNLRLEVSMPDGTGKVIAVGSGVANQSNDGTTFEMQFADSLLGGGGGGLSFVTHDATLTGDGTVSNPLAITNGAVVRSLNGLKDNVTLAGGGSTTVGTVGSTITLTTPVSLPPSGAAGGDLSGTYPNPTFKLPYNAITRLGSPGFLLSNTGVGSDAIGVYGHSDNAAGVIGTSDSGNGVKGFSSGDYGTAGVYGVGDRAHSTGVTGMATGGGTAGWFSGNVGVTGTLSKGGGSFKIDHPLDPEHKYLYHSFVESPDMMNIYNGNVTTDGSGEAIIELPVWFEALNRDFRYQLTVIGGGDVWAQARVARKIEANRFAIQTNAPNIEVSWQVTGIRKDPFANKHRIPVEEDKPSIEQGSYLHPDAYGQPEEKGIDWARNPEMMRKMKAERENAAAAKP